MWDVLDMDVTGHKEADVAIDIRTDVVPCANRVTFNVSELISFHVQTGLHSMYSN